MSLDFKSIVISGSGPKSIGFMGCLHQLEENDILQLVNIDTFVGVSSGSMLCYLLIIGYTPLELLQHITNDKVFKELYLTKNISNVLNGKGIFDYNVINKYIQHLTFLKTNKYNITFAEIREHYKKRLVICSYNETERKTIYFDSSNPKYDDLSCTIAIRCSSNIPYVFSDFIYKDCEYIDGGVCDNLPIHIADDKLHHVLVLVTNLYSNTTPKTKQDTLIKKLINRIQIPIWSMIQRRLETASPKIKLIDIQLDFISIYDFDLDTSMILDMFNIGMEHANIAPSEWKLQHVKQD